MTYRNLLVGVAALGLTLVASGAFAESTADARFTCHTWTPSKTSPPMTHCVTWSREAQARLHASGCDPAKMPAEAMRARCAELSAEASSAAPSSNR